MSQVLAVDIGGTKVALALADTGCLAGPRVVRFDTPADGPAALSRIVREGRALVGAGKAIPVGVSFGGHVDGERVHSLHVPGWDDAGLVPTLRAAFGGPVRVANDAEAGALAELAARADDGVRDLVYVTVSTGVGAAVVAAGRIVRGSHGLAGEIGHMKVTDTGLCSCGGTGHVEAVASGTAIGLRASREGLIVRGAGAPTARAVARAAETGDPTARRILAEAGDALGRALAMTALCVDPEVICLGGGVSGAGEAFWGPLRRAVDAGTLRPVAVERARRGPDAALAGALLLVADPILTADCLG
jgi:glucokinase